MAVGWDLNASGHSRSIRESVGNDDPQVERPDKRDHIFTITEEKNETNARAKMIQLFDLGENIDNCLEKREKPNILESYGLYRKLKKPKV